MYIFSQLDKNKKATINPINDDDKCFQYVATVALNHKELEKTYQRISKIKPCIKKYNRKVLNYRSGRDDWKKFEKINPAIVFYVL